MRFPFRLLNGLEDAQRNFEELERTADSQAGNVQALRSLGRNAGQALAGNQMARGTTTLTWPGATPNATVTVNHGLGAIPIGYSVGCSRETGGFYVICDVTVSSTQLSFAAYTPQGNPLANATATVGWIASL